MATLDAVKTPLDPRRIAKTPGSHLAYLRDHPPDVLEQSDRQHDIRAALDVMAAMRTRIGGDAWPGLQHLQQTEQRYRRRGWTGPATELADAVQAISAGPGIHVLEHIDTIARLSLLVPRIERHWETLDEAGQTRLTAALSIPEADAASEGSLRHLVALCERAPTTPGDTTAGAAKVERVAPSAPVEAPLPRAPYPPVAARLSLTASPAIDETWQHQTERLRQQCENAEVFRSRVTRLRDFLRDLDWAVPVNPHPGTANKNGEWTNEHLAEVWQRRDAGLRNLLAIVDWSSGQQAPSFDQFRQTAAWSEHIAPFEAWRAGPAQNVQ